VVPDPGAGPHHLFGEAGKQLVEQLPAPRLQGVEVTALRHPPAVTQVMRQIVPLDHRHPGVGVGEHTGSQQAGDARPSTTASSAIVVFVIMISLVTAGGCGPPTNRRPTRIVGGTGAAAPRFGKSGQVSSGAPSAGIHAFRTTVGRTRRGPSPVRRQQRPGGSDFVIPALACSHDDLRRRWRCR
jgi:hypothetical protein